MHVSASSLAIAAVLCIFLVTGDDCPYKGYKLVRLDTHSQQVPDLIYQLELQQPNKFDVWHLPKTSGRPIYLATSSIGYHQLTKILRDFPVNFTVLFEDLQKEIHREKLNNQRAKFSKFFRTGTKPLNYYKTFDEINIMLDTLAGNYSFVTVEVLGYTVEQRPLKGVLISLDKSRPIIWIDAGIHAREWIAPAAALSIIDKLVHTTGRILLKKFQFFIVPLVNPDGYVFTHSKHRLWRKNRAKIKGELCIGTDLNRNFPFKWGVGNGASPDPCSDIYRGSSPGSEAETQSLMKKLNSMKHQVILFLSLHSYGQYILTPYGFSRDQYPFSYDKLILMGLKAKDAILYRHGYSYKVGTSSELLYEASGASDDYAVGELGIPYAYTIELSDEGRYGFLLPPSFIGHVGRQLWTAIKVFARNIQI